ncbi:MAG: hypothetical protein ACRC24_06060 [Vibrionaceae bacterium]
MIAPTGAANGQGSVAGSNGDDPPKKRQDGKLAITDVKAAAETPQTQGAAAPASNQPAPEHPTLATRMAILHFAQNLFEPESQQIRTNEQRLLAGAYYLAEQQANRQNHPEPKPLRDYVFSSAVAAAEMESVAEKLRGVPIPAEQPFRAICSTIVNAKSLVFTDVEQPAPVAPQGAQRAPSRAPVPPVPNAVDWSQYSRIYIPGYGMPGLDLIKQGGERFTARQVAQKLADSGALTHVKDVRITSSGSSQELWHGYFAPPAQPAIDGQRGQVLQPYLLDLRSASVSDGASFVQRPLPPEFNDRIEAPDCEANRAFAQAVSSELEALGYEDVTVSGYAGKEIPVHDASIDQHERRMDPFAVGQTLLLLRRSEVRMQYKVELRFREPEVQPPADQLGAAAAPEQEDDE